MEAVAAVIQNRANDLRWPPSFAAVCKQRAQFSCWLSNDPNLPKLLEVGLEDPQFAMAYAIAARAAADDLEDRIAGANHYLTSALFERSDRPSWADPDAVTCRVGRHVFLRL